MGCFEQQGPDEMAGGFPAQGRLERLLSVHKVKTISALQGLASWKPANLQKGSDKSEVPQIDG
ncbi:MAG: hypothetical protein ACM34A_06865 [Bacillota bacterium]